MNGVSPSLFPLKAEVESFLGAWLRPYYGGSFHDPSSGVTFEVVDPSWGRLVTEVGQADRVDVDLAVKAAREAFDSGPWRNRFRPTDRQRCLLKLSELIDRDAEILAQIDSLDSGKPVHKVLGDVRAAAEHLAYYAGWCTKLEGRTFPVDPEGMLVYSVREPVGVVGLITPWNYPLLMAVWKLAPALAAGNCVVLKPAEETPLSALFIARLFEEAGFPPGVFNVVPGPGPKTGAALVRHSVVDKVGFTGSVEVAREILQESVGNLKRVSLELGGKSPNVIFADADLEAAIVGSTWAIFGNNGQSCTAGSRLYVERTVYEEVLDGIAARASAIAIGPGLSTERPDLGPLVSAEHQSRVGGWLENAEASGMRTMIGGQAPTGVPEGGYYLAPTILVDGNDSHLAARREIFGPVVVAMPFDHFDEVVRRANDTDSGLAAGVWTNDLGKANAFASRVRAGTVWINSWGLTSPGVPFGGMKQSGHGREMGQAAFDLYTEIKSVWVGHGG